MSKLISNMKKRLAHRSNYGGTRSLDTIKYIVVHYTGNDGDSDENNGNYFANNAIQTSAHYFVDSDSVTQSVPDNYIAWHCGAYSYKHPTCRNSNSIGVEICDDRRNGVVYPTNETIANAVELVQYLMDKYNIPKANVIRHYDVTGKKCPEYWSGNAKNDGFWKSEFWNKLKEKGTESKPSTSQQGVFYCVQTGAFNNKAYAEEQLKKVKAAGFETYMVKIDGKYKIQVGAYRNKSGAEETAKKLTAAGFPTYITTKVG